MKKKTNFERNLIVGGVGLSLGSKVVAGFPANAVNVGVQDGLGIAGDFFSPMVNIHMGGKIIKGLKSFKEVK